MTTRPHERQVTVTAADGQPVGAWLDFPAGGGVLLRCGKVDLGTGVRTAMAQIAAEELGTTADRVHVVAGRTGVTPDEGYTAGSRSVREGGAAVRRAAATAREVLLDRAAATAAVPREDCELTPEGVRVGDRTVALSDLAALGPMDEPVRADVPTVPYDEYRVVGRPAERPEMADKVVGVPTFVTDVRVPGMIHGRVVRPPAFDSHLLDVDDASVPPHVRVVREGDFLGLVADREGEVVAAAAALRVTWGPGRPLPAHDDLFGWMRRQPCDDLVVRDVGRPAEGRVEVLERSYRWPFQAHASIGPSCAVADVRDDGVTVHAAAQGVYQLRSGLANLLGVDSGAVEVVHHEGSGCYGHNGADDVAADAALLSRAVGAPVRVQWSRRDEFVWARKGPAMLMDRRLGVDAGGRVVSWQGGTWTSTHGGRAQDPLRFVAGHLAAGVPAPEDRNHVGGDRNAAVDYEVGHQHVVLHRLSHSPLPASSLRALGATANAFANEVAMDEAALAAGADPLEFRMRHVQDPRGRAVLQAVARASDWGAPLPVDSGRGVAYARYENSGAYLALVAQVRVDPDEPVLRVERLTLAQDCGLVIDPAGLRQQLEGNLVQGLSRALLEEVRWEDDRLLLDGWEDYPILRFGEVPEIRVEVVEPADAPPEGVGEPATIVVAPAVSNAVAAAVGWRLREVPFDGRRLREAREEAGT